MAKLTLKGQVIHTNAELPAIGSKALDFTLVNAELQNKHLKDFAAKRKILSIVPSLDTSVCSLSAKKFNEKMASYPHVKLLVISADLPFAQKRFCAAEKLSHITTLSMMRSKDFARDYGLLIQDGPLAGLCARAILVLDEKDHVIYTELVGEITHEPNYEKALATL